MYCLLLNCYDVVLQVTMIVGINIFKSIIYSMSSSEVVDIMNYLVYGLSTTFYNFINQNFLFFA